MSLILATLLYAGCSSVSYRSNMISENNADDKSQEQKALEAIHKTFFVDHEENSHKLWVARKNVMDDYPKFLQKLEEFLPHLEVLTFSIEMGDKNFTELCKKNLSGLESLNIIGIKITCLSCKTLAEVDLNLKSLSIGGNDIGNKGCEYISKYKIPKLENLYLDHINMESIGCKYLSNANWEQLQSLCISNNLIRNKGCEYLSRSNWFNMKSIELANNEIDDAGCSHLSKSTWVNLEYLQLAHNKLKITYALSLSKARFPEIKFLGLAHNPLISVYNLKFINCDWNQLKTLCLWAPVDNKSLLPFLINKYNKLDPEYLYVS